MVRFVLFGLIALSTVPGVSPGQHMFDCVEATLVTCRTSWAGGCRLKTVPPCSGGRSALTTPARLVI